MNMRWLLALFCLLLLLPIVIAEEFEEMKQVILTRDNDTVEVAVMVLKTPAKKDIIDFKKKYEEYTQLLRSGEEAVLSNAFQELKEYAEAQSGATLSTLKDAEVKLFYLSAAGEVPDVPGCEGVIVTSKEKKVKSATGEITYYYGTCKLKLDDPIFRSRCRDLIARYLPKDGKAAFDGTDTVCDTEMTPINVFTSGLAGIIAPTQSTYPICFAVSLLFGLLLASMYFSGKSPISLLDITTPRLPGPKGLVASGQVIAPLGYGELKKTTKAKMSAAIEALKPAMQKATPFARMVTREIKKSDIRTFLTVTIEKARKYNLITEKEAKALVKDPQLRSEKSNEMLGKLFTGIEKAAATAGNKRDVLESALLRDYYVGMMQSRYLEVLSGHPGIGKKGPFVGKVQTVISTVVGRFPMLGPLVGGSFDSAVRSARVMGRFTKAVSAEAIRTTIGEKRMKELEEAAKRSKAAEALYNYLMTAAPHTMVIGGFYPITNRAGELYRTLYNEAHYDMIKYMLKKLYEKYGMNFKVTVEEMAEMGYKDVDILKKCGFRYSKELAAIEDEIKGILALSPDRVSVDEKVRMIAELMRKHGVALDPAMWSAKAELDRIERENVEDHVKMVILYDYLSNEHRIQDPEHGKYRVNPDRFSFSIGHNTLGEYQAFENLVLRRLIYDAENGMLLGRIEDALKGTYLYIVNRLNTLGGFIDGLKIDPITKSTYLPSELYTAEELKKINQRTMRYAADLMTDAGVAKFKELLRAAGEEVFDPKKNPEKLTPELLMLLTYGGPEIARKYKLAKENMFGTYTAPDGRMYWWGHDQELPPDKSWWKVDMKRHWLSKVGDAAGDIALGKWVQSRFLKAHVPPYNADIERKIRDELVRRHGDEVAKYEEPTTWTPRMIEERTTLAKKFWISHLLEEDLKSFMNSVFANNAYGYTNDTAHFYGKIMAGFLAGMLREKGYDDRDSTIARLENIHLEKRDERKFLQDVLRTYAADLREYLSKNVTYDMISKAKYPLVMLHEGGIAPYIKGMNLSDYDRPLGGNVVIKDADGRWRRFDPDHQRIAFDDRPDLDAWFSRLSMQKDKSLWQAPQPELGGLSFLDAVAEWAANDFEKQKVFNGVLWRYAHTTDDWKGFWDRSAITIKPKREAVPMSPLTWRMIAQGEMPGIEKFQKVRNFFLSLGDFLTRASLAAGGPLLEAGYAITPFSEYYREQSWRLAQQIKSFTDRDWDIIMQDVASPAERAKLRKAYEEVAMAHFPYHQVWDYAIDRNPWRTSTSYGSYQNWGGFFHFGPSTPFPMRLNYRAYMNRAEYIAFEAMNWPMRVARKVVMPFIHSVRGIQQAMQGYPSKWDQTFSPMKPWDHTPVRIRDFLSALNPITTFFSTFSPEHPKIAKYYNKVRDKIFKYEFTNPLVQHDLAGAGIGAGLKQGPQDIYFTRKGIYASARTGEANPGASYYDYRHVLQLDNCLAEYLSYRAREHSAYFRQDRYVMEQALKTTVKRQVAAEALALRREHELRGFGMLQNPIYGWFNPALFIWHNPILPQLSPKELVAGAAQRIRQGGVRGQWAQMFRDYSERGWQSLKRGMMSWMTDRIVYCPICQTAGYRGQVCKRCHHLLY